MARRAAIPQDNKEWPDYEYRAWPKWIGRDEFGQDLVANSPEDVPGLEERKVYPKELGLDAKGNKVEALHPDELSTKKTLVVRKIEQVTEAGNRLETKNLEDENARLRRELEEAKASEPDKTSKGKRKAA